MFTTRKLLSNSRRKLTRAAPSIITEKIFIGGDVIGEGALELEGRIEGNVRCLSVTVRVQGKVKGDITAERVEIHGIVDGNVRARFVHLGATARISGTITHQNIQIEPGAHFDGQCKRVTDPRAADSLKALPSPHIRLISNNVANG